MRRSLQRRLSLILGTTLILAAMVATAISFVLAYGEAKEFQDDMLRQVAHLAAAPGSPASEGRGDGKLPVALSDPESRLQVFHLPGESLPMWWSVPLAAGFHTLETPDGKLRVFVYTSERQQKTVAAQPTDARDEIALDSALRTLVPLVLLLPIIAALVIRIVRRELAPVNQMAGHLDEQPAEQPRALPEQQVPEEVLPFVQAINRLLGRVNEMLGQQRRFIADAAHELRSPLTALSVQAQNLAHAGSMEEVRVRVEPLRAGIDRARNLTEQLLSLARSQAGSTETENLDVSQLTRDLIAEFIPTAEARQIDLGMEGGEPMRVLAKADALRLVIRNALDNALKYAPPGSNVTVRLYAEGNDAVIDVIDEGPGIPESERSRVFDAFYRLNDAQGDGSGLGLAIAREAATRMNGSVTLLDAPIGTGLVFRYRQPLGGHARHKSHEEKK